MRKAPLSLSQLPRSPLPSANASAAPRQGDPQDEGLTVTKSFTGPPSAERWGELQVTSW